MDWKNFWSISEYFRNRREMKLRKWCVEMAVKAGSIDPVPYSEDIYRWVKAIPDKKS